MKKLDRLILRSYIGPFIMTFAISCFFLVMQFLWKYVDDMMGKGLEWFIIGKLLGLASVKLVILGLPLAVLLSSIMVMGSFSENSELVAMRSAGMSHFRILRPLTLAICALAIGAFFFMNEVWPVANLKFRTLLWDVTKKKPTIQIKENIFYDGIEGYTIRVGSKKENGRLEDVLIYDHSDRKYRGNRKVIRSKEGSMKKTEEDKYLIFTLNDGVMYQEMDQEKERKKREGHPHMITRFEKQVMRFDLMGFQFERSDEELFSDDDQMLDLSQLNGMMDSLKHEIRQRTEKGVEKMGRGLWVLRDSSKTDLPGPSPPDSGKKELEEKDRNSVLEIAKEEARKNKERAHVLAVKKKQKIKKKRGYMIEWHRKFTLASACVVLFFIGGSLGTIIRRGGMGAPLVASVLLFLLYHILMKSGEEMASEGALPVWAGMWMATAILLPMGIFLTYKAANDSKQILPSFSFPLWSKKLFRRKDKAIED